MSSSSWDELLCSGTWLYYACGEIQYVETVTRLDIATKLGAFLNNPPSFSCYEKGAQVLYWRADSVEPWRCAHTYLTSTS
ncbi:unnamed protein product [Microthlaspi erraticum]|uniref:Uncharacterized protein n=1 Tax=Microthlaspi erraticum TaxID=1685480 RepID=A0A6D2L370_9BRAS|nr:unnamed protein product [Microthlaspi erraticum]